MELRTAILLQNLVRISEEYSTEALITVSANLLLHTAARGDKERFTILAVCNDLIKVLEIKETIH